ncbi:MAG: amidohydrolase family protein, partial [Lachnospiraceae bacterium]
MENLREQLEAAKGLRPYDVLLENVKIVNVFTEEIMEGCIGIYGQRIVAVNPKKKEAKTVIDGQGCYAVPGFIDAHIHIETTLLTPEALGDVIIPWGTTSLCVDAMEIANVAGMEGLQALIKDMDQLPFRLYLEIPSRVPTAPGLETTGGVLGVEEVTELLDLPQAISLGELDPSKILGIREEYLAKIAASLAKNKVCNGHAIGLSPEALNVYAAGHLSDDHESVEYEELLDRLRVGIKALIREGSSERNVEKLITGVVQNNLSTENLMYCTDDKHVNDIAREGHISYNIEKSIALGLDQVKAIKIATINAAKHFRMEQDIGSITPGRYADIVLLKDLKTIKPVMVMKGGRVVADVNGAKPCPKKEYPSKLFDSVHISPTFSENAFKIPAVGQRALCRVIEMIKDQIINNELHEWMLITDGEIRQEVERDILKLS